jgi:pSer/pThr/pTyr-binding forkhead associated (FHA) protein
MKWCLVVGQGVQKGKIIPLPSSPFVIGRDKDCQLRPASPSVSHRHCALLVQGERVILCDFNSTNGTFVNAQRVKGEVELHSGDRFGIGPLTFVVFREGNKPTTQTEQDPATENQTEMVDEDAIAAILLGMEEEDAHRPLVSGENSRTAGTTKTEMPSISASQAGPETGLDPQDGNTNQANEGGRRDLGKIWPPDC